MGIPTTFVVQKGKIVWIGHPIKLDSIIEPILAGTYDVAANKKRYDSASAGSRKQNSEMMALYNAVQAAEKAKDFNKAFRLIDEGTQKVPILKMSLRLEKFKILLNNYTEAEAMSYARELSKEDKSYSTMIAVTICDKDSLSKAAYQYAAEGFKEISPTNSLILDKMALAYSKAGNLKEAIETGEKAVALAKIEVKDPAFGGRVFDYTITDFEAKVKKYKDALK
jgi:ribosome-binding ATPase YchF (GTP1/OBG family)